MTFTSYEDVSYEDWFLAQAEEQHRERDVEAQLEDRFLAAQPLTDKELVLEDLPF